MAQESLSRSLMMAIHINITRSGRLTGKCFYGPTRNFGCSMLMWNPARSHRLSRPAAGRCGTITGRPTAGGSPIPCLRTLRYQKYMCISWRQEKNKPLLMIGTIAVVQCSVMMASISSSLPTATLTRYTAIQNGIMPTVI